MSRHPDQLPTGRPTVGERRSYSAVPAEERLGIGIVGLHEGHTALVALRASGQCRAVAGCDLVETKRAEAVDACPGLWVTDSYAALLEREDVDVIAIYTPDALHADQILAAFQAGKHVLCTKPLINDATRIPELIAAANASGKRLQVGQSTRYYEPFQRQREQFEQGMQGTAEVVDAHYNHRMDWYYEKSPWTIQESHWAYLGLSHPVDLVRWYIGPIQTVHAVGTRTELGKRYGMPHPDAISVHMVSKTGAIGRAFGNYGFHELPRARALIECWLMGSQGSSLARYPDLRLNYHDARGVEIEEDYHHAMAGYYYRHELKGMHYGEFCNYFDDFASRIRDGRPNSPDLLEGLQTVLTMDSIVRSLETGLPVEVPVLDGAR